MKDPTTSQDLNEDPNELNKKVVKRQDVWIIPDRYYLELDLDPIEALIFTIIRQTGKRKGFSEVSYSYLKKYTKIKDNKTIAKILKRLESSLLIYIHRYTSRRGKRAKLVHQENSGKYWTYLTACKQFGERKKFEDTFLSLQNIEIDPEDDPDSKLPIPESASGSDAHGKSASGNNPCAASGNNPHAINTTYLRNRKNDVTCKGPDGPSAASSSSLKEELEHAYSKADVKIMMQWYEMQTASKKEGMKKPIACIIKAFKDGYAQEEVASQNAEVAAKLFQEREVNLKKVVEKKEMGTNEQLAKQLVDKFSNSKGWRHSLDSKGFTVFNDSAEKRKDTETNATYYVMPNGDHHWGCLGLRATFDLPHKEFKNILKKYFSMSEWVSHQTKEKIQA